MKGKTFLLLAFLLGLAGCNAKATLDHSRVHYITVDGRKFEVRVAPTGAPDEYRLLVVRATLVIDPDPERERQRDSAVAWQAIQQVCDGKRPQVLEHSLVDNVNFVTRFRCS